MLLSRSLVNLKVKKTVDFFVSDFFYSDKIVLPFFYGFRLHALDC